MKPSILTPPPLIKTFSEESHAINFAQGNLILRSLDYFRQLEDIDPRTDRNESTVKRLGLNNIPTTTTLTNDVLSLCLWIPQSPSWREENKHFGDSHVKIISPCKLFSEIRETLKFILLKDSSSYFGRVGYMDYGESIKNPKDLNNTLEKMKQTAFFCDEVYANEAPFLQGTPGIECAFTKENKFQNENEARMVFLFEGSNINALLNRKIKIRLMKKEIDYGTLTGPAKPSLKICEFLDYSSWNSDRHNPNLESPYKVYNHWIEIHLQEVSTTHFQLIN